METLQAFMLGMSAVAMSKLVKNPKVIKYLSKLDKSPRFAFKNAGDKWFDSAKIAEKALSKNLLTPNLTIDEKEAIRYYTGGGFHSINKHLRGHKGFETIEPHANTAIKRLTEAIDKTNLNEPMIVHRGFDHQQSNKMLADKIGLKMEDISDPIKLRNVINSGHVFTDNGFGSTSIATQTAWQGVQMHVYCPSGTKGLYVDKLSTNPGEYEYLLQRNTKYRLTGIAYDDKGNITDIMTEIVSQVIDK